MLGKQARENFVKAISIKDAKILEKVRSRCHTKKDKQQWIDILSSIFCELSAFKPDDRDTLAWLLSLGATVSAKAWRTAYVNNNTDLLRWFADHS